MTHRIAVAVLFPKPYVGSIEPFHQCLKTVYPDITMDEMPTEDGRARLIHFILQSATPFSEAARMALGQTAKNAALAVFEPPRGTKIV